MVCWVLGLSCMEGSKLWYVLITVLALHDLVHTRCQNIMCSVLSFDTYPRQYHKDKAAHQLWICLSQFRDWSGMLLDPSKGLKLVFWLRPEFMQKALMQFDGNFPEPKQYTLVWGYLNTWTYWNEDHNQRKPSNSSMFNSLPNFPSVHELDWSLLRSLP